MSQKNRTLTVYGLLLAVWIMILIWQAVEHTRYKESARTALLDHARDISSSLGVAIRSMRQWRHFGIIPQPMLDAALQELVKSSEMRAMALLNSTGQVVASAGNINVLDLKDLPPRGERWGTKTVTFVNLVDLGLDNSQEGEDYHPTIVLPEPDIRDRGRRSGGPPMPGEPMSREPRPEGPPDEPRPSFAGTDSVRSPSSVGGASRENRIGADRIPGVTGNPNIGPAGPMMPPRFFRRPFWMDEVQYASLLKQQGLHGFVLGMSTDAFEKGILRDLGLRSLMGSLALVAVIGLGLAWRTLDRSAELQMRLIRAGEMNTRLREMNIAAAGLAHETKNPLNLVRGMAQMISMQEDIPSDIQERSRKITEEVDRVTARLNEFIDYSKPREPRPTPVPIQGLFRDVERALQSDIEDKEIQFVLDGPELVVEADEMLLRQVLFNLLLNAVQAVDHGGRIEVRIKKYKANEAGFEVHDNGPGVPEDKRKEIFRPYFTTNKEGTGLGLAVVQQIVLAHGWEIECLPNEKGGAAFRVGGLKATTRMQD